jgi:hypothetical protein
VLIDVHAHFYTARSPRADWRDINTRRLAAGKKIGITAHVASVLGSWGWSSPVYFPSPDDVTKGNAAMLGLCQEHPGLVYGYCTVNPNFTDHALKEIMTRLREGMIGVKLAASRRANDPLLDPIAELAGEKGVPILHHVWQHRRHDWPGQEASDAAELAQLAERHARTNFILAHIGGGGDWAHSLRVLRGASNIWVDLSGSGVDAGMLEAVLDAVGAERMLFGCDITLDTGWAKLRYLQSLGLPKADLERIRAGNAKALFPRGAFGR